MRKTCLWVIGAFGCLLGCTQSTTPALVSLPAASSPSAPPEASAPNTAAPLPDGVVLRAVRAPSLHPLRNTLLVSALDPDESKAPHRRFYLLAGGRLRLQKELSLPPTMASESFMAVGTYPDQVYALSAGDDGNRSTSHFLHLVSNAWTDLGRNPAPHWIAAWEEGIFGLVRDPANPMGQRLLRLDDTGPELELPKDPSASCNALYANSGPHGFPNVAVQPRGLVSVENELYLLGMGCDRRVGIAIWSKLSAAPQVISLDEPMFFDGFGGTVFGGGRGDERFYFRRAMRPMAGAALWHKKRGRWSKVAWPVDDPQVESVCADSGGKLWAVLDEKLVSLSNSAEGGPSGWKEQALPKDCQPQSVAVMDNTLWIACADSVAKLSITIQNP